jgi:hypothetical protein
MVHNKIDSLELEKQIDYTKVTHLYSKPEIDVL